MNSRTVTGLVALLMMLAPMAAMGVSAEHGPTQTADYISALPGVCPGDDCPSDTAGLEEAAGGDAGFVPVPEVGEDYAIPTSALHLDVPVSAWSDGAFSLGDLIVQGDDNKDLDGDGYSDVEEVFCESNPLNPASTCNDPDADGLVDANRDGLEEHDGAPVGTSAWNPDTDGDGYGDGEELEATGPGAPYDPLDPASNPGLDDTDGDGRLDEDEPAGCKSNPDCDGDGLSDGDEVDVYETKPDDAHSDEDTLNDGDEVLVHGTNPNKRDSDGDGLDDDKELSGSENSHSGGGNSDPLLADTDADGLNDGKEAELDTDPRGETDTDGLSDGREVNGWCSDPLIPHGGLCAALGAYHTSDPFLADTDGDTFDDRAEHDAGTDPNNAQDFPGAGSGEPAGLPAGDETDLHDTDDDGNHDDPNGQVDAVERRIVLDVDEQDDQTPAQPGELEGSDGFTLTVHAPADPASPTTNSVTILTLRVGDVRGSEAAEAAVFMFHGYGGAPTVSVCVVPAAAPPVSVGTGFYPESTDPCNEPAGEDPDRDGDGIANGDDICPDDADHTDADGNGTPDCAEEGDGGLPVDPEELPGPGDVPEDHRDLAGLFLPSCYDPEHVSETLCHSGGGFTGIRLRALGQSMNI